MARQRERFEEDEEFLNEEEAEEDSKRMLEDDEYISAVFLRDKCDEVYNLLYCLETLFNDDEIRLIKSNPTAYLFEKVRGVVREIEQGLRKL